MSDDKNAFEKFYKKNIDKVFRFVYFRVGGNREQAEDLVSEIFMKALNNFASFDVTRGESAWILTIARNHLANYWRDRKVTVALPDAEEENVDVDSFWLTAGLKQWAKEEDLRLVHDILAKLPAEQSKIVTFHYLYGYSYKEIAEMLTTSEGALKVAAHRALRKLKELI